MATYTAYLNGESTIQRNHTDPQGGPGVCFFTADFDASKLNLTTSDKAQIMQLPAGVYVEEVTVRILTADAGGAALSVGDGAQAVGYGSYATLSATGPLAIAAGSATTYLYTNTTNAKVKPKLLGAANDYTIYIAPTTATITTLKVRVTVRCYIPQ